VFIVESIFLNYFLLKKIKLIFLDNFDMIILKIKNLKNIILILSVFLIL